MEQLQLFDSSTLERGSPRAGSRRDAAAAWLCAGKAMRRRLRRLWRQAAASYIRRGR